MHNSDEKWMGILRQNEVYIWLRSSLKINGSSLHEFADSSERTVILHVEVEIGRLISRSIQEDFLPTDGWLISLIPHATAGLEILNQGRQSEWVGFRSNASQHDVRRWWLSTWWKRLKLRFSQFFYLSFQLEIKYKYWWFYSCCICWRISIISYLDHSFRCPALT